MVWRKIEQGQLSSKLEDNVAYIQSKVAAGIDIVYRDFRLGNGQKATVFFVDGLVNRDVLDRDLFRPLMYAKKEGRFNVYEIQEEIVNLASVEIAEDLDSLIDGVLQGLTALLIDGSTLALKVESIAWQQRGVNEPSTDVVVRGPREGFVETMRINLSLMRRKIHHPDLTIESLKVGRYSKTEIALVYVRGVVNEDVLAELHKRLEQIDIDAVLDSGYIEQFIQDTPYSIFPTVGVTEKPDIAAGKIMEGRVLILVDGSPMALTVPFLFVEGMQNSEDYYQRFYYASMIRIIRLMALFITILLPGIYAAITNYHHQIIPTNLLISMAAAEANTPFSTGFSLLIIGLAYEILREAGVRLPRPAGQAVSIVGAIVMGDAAVSSGLISAPVLIVLAITVISSYVTVTLQDSTTLLRLVFLFLGWGMGFFGMLLGMMILTAYLCCMRSFGVPYFSPFEPLSLSGLRDALVRFPLFKLNKRPSILSKNRHRMGRHEMPLASEEEHA